MQDSKLKVVISDLSSGVDVYADWIDACDAVAQDAVEPAPDERPERSYPGLTAEYSRDPQFQSDQHILPSLEMDDEYSKDYDDS